MQHDMQVSKGLVTEESVPARIGGIRIPLLPSGLVYKFTKDQQPPTILPTREYAESSNTSIVQGMEEDANGEVRRGFRSELLELSWYALGSAYKRHLVFI